MASRGPQSFKKRQKEQQRKEKQMEKAAKRQDRKNHPHSEADDMMAPDHRAVMAELAEFSNESTS
jgi:hypothetical protein